MKAAVYLGKEQLPVQTVADPTLDEGEMLLAIDSCSVCGTDLRTYRHGDAKIKPPRILGHEFCGRVVESEWCATTLRRAAHAQTTAHLGVLTCALERHRLATGILPQTLDALVPTYLAKLPRQVVHDQPFHYRLETDGGFTLWSEGWDLTDDGGNISPFEGFAARDASDWGYRLPARPKLGPK